MKDSILEQIIKMDTEWFYKINSQWTNPWLDQIMPVFTDLHKVSWFITFVAPFIFAIWIFKARKRAIGAICTSAIAVAIADAASYRIVKQYIQRERPPAILKDIHLLTDQYAGFSFTSNHAANSFAVAAVLVHFWPQHRIFWFIAALIAYSRVYVGVHFPLDVIGGAILGFYSGRLAIWISQKLLRLYRKFFTSSAADLPEPPPKFRNH